MFDLCSKICRIVSGIPRGKVITYSQLAEALGDRRRINMALLMLCQNPYRSRIPFHRVIPETGEVKNNIFSIGRVNIQKKLLEMEGIEFEGDRISDLSKYLWSFEKIDM